MQVNTGGSGKPGPLTQFQAADMADWATSGGVWEFNGRSAQHEDPGRAAGLLSWTGHRFADVEVQFDVKITKQYGDIGENWAGVQLHNRNPMALSIWQEGYLVMIRSRGRLEISAQGIGGLATRDTGLDPTKQAVHMRVQIRGSQLSVWVDDQPPLVAQNSQYKTGEVAFVNYFNGANYSNISIQGDEAALPPLTVVKTVQPVLQKRAPVKPLPRIGTRRREGLPGQYIRLDTGEVFSPQGYNYTELGTDTRWHSVFNTKTYDSARIESMLTALQAAGANSIRVWAWGDAAKPDSWCGPVDSRGLNSAYLENIADFLRRCTAHSIYVIPVLDETPRNLYFNYITDKFDRTTPGPGISGYNRQYLCKGLIEAKAEAVKQFVTAIKKADPGLLNCVLAWSFANEVFVNGQDAPFSRSTGSVTTANGRSYRMDNRAQRQACYDDGMIYWANRLSDVVKKIDPKALTTAGMWTADAFRRAPDGGVNPNEGVTGDTRYCPRPSILSSLQSKLDCLDIHIYPWGDSPIVNKKGHEWEALCKNGKPVVVGEYGAFTHIPLEQARQQVLTIRRQIKELGYTGGLFWTWNLTGPGCYSGVENGFAELLRPPIVP